MKVGMRKPRSWCPDIFKLAGEVSEALKHSLQENRHPQN